MNEKPIVMKASSVSRGKRQSAAAAVAYATGQKLKDNYNGRTYDYSHREDVLHWNLLLPKMASGAMEDCQRFLDLWNRAEKRKDSLMAHTYIMALPNELPADQSILVVEDFLDASFIKNGYPAIYAVHSGIVSEHPKPARLDAVYAREDNPHVHIIVPFRKVDEYGFQPTKIEGRATYRKEFLLGLRESWAENLNLACERLGLAVRFDHRSYKDRGLDRRPTPHIGLKAMALEMQGIETDVGNQYMEIIYQNKERERRLIYEFDHEDEREMELER